MFRVELFSNLNSSTTVERDGRQVVYTTLTYGRNLIAANTHLNQLIGNHLSTLVREVLVTVNRTCCAISITHNVDVGVVLLSILSNRLNVNKILLRSNVGLVDVEEYRYRRGYEFLNSLRLSRLLVSQHVLQTSVFRSSIVQLSVKSVHLSL